jgi:hypothetical protein
MRAGVRPFATGLTYIVGICLSGVREYRGSQMPKRREPPKPERPKARYPTPAERDERVAIPLEFDQTVKGLLAVDPGDNPCEEDGESRS